MKKWTKDELENLKQKVNKLWGWMSLEDMDAIIKYALKLPENPTILEIGTGMGRSALLMALVRPDAQIHTVDGFGQYGYNDTAAISLHSKKGYVYNKSNQEYAEKIWKDFDAKNITLYVADSRTFKWDKKTHMIFIDGDHSYQGVKDDFERFSPSVVNNGFVLFHDVLTRAGGCEVFMFIEELEQMKGWRYKVEANVGIAQKV